MSNDNVFALKNPGVANEVRDALTEVLREGARTLLAQAIEAEVAEFLTRHGDQRDAAGRLRLVRNGSLPERTIQTSLGDVPVQAPRVRDRAGQLRFSSAILPPYLRRTKTIEELLPWLYLKGLSTGDFAEALSALLGRAAPGLSAGTISRLKGVWTAEHARWERRSLAKKQYAYLWVDGIHFGATREQRCWVHKTANVLNKLPKHLQAKPKSDLHQIWMAATREQAHTAFATFVHTYEPKYPKAAECLAKDKIALLAFYDFPAAHWMHLRTTNPIESTFATVRLRTAKTRGCVSRGSILSMVFKLVKSAEMRWRALRGSELIAKVITGIKFKNGVEVNNQSRQKVAA